MPDLTEVYGRGVGLVASRRRVYAGLSLFGCGALAVVAAIAVATTDLASWLDLGTFAAREVAGVLAGLGLPAAILGSFALLPASRRTRAASLIGGSLAVLGVALFTEAYPYQWVGASGGPGYTLPVAVVYSAGVLTTFWCLFLAVANFKTRNDPGGTVRMEVTEEGTTRVLEVSGSVPGLGGVGFVGDGVDGEAETQTNRDDVLYSRDQSPAAGGSQPASDGGSAAATPDGDEGAAPTAAEVERAVRTRGRPDEYCGNCEHFQYVRVDGDLEPACTLHEEVMADMDACEQWQENG